MIGFVGDSLTLGLYASSQDQAYPQLVAAALHARTVVQAVSGVAATSIDDQASPPTGVDMVVVELGTNDFDQPIGSFERHYRALIDRMRAAAPKARFVCLGVWRGSTDRSTRTGLTPVAFDLAILHACPGSFLSLTAMYMDPELHGPVGRSTWQGPADWFHPNDAGHRRLADTLIQLLPTK